MKPRAGLGWLTAMLFASAPLMERRAFDLPHLHPENISAAEDLIAQCAFPISVTGNVAGTAIRILPPPASR